MTICSGRERCGRIALRRCMVVRSTPQAKRWKRYRHTLSTFHVSSLPVPPTPMTAIIMRPLVSSSIVISLSLTKYHLSIHVIITFDFAVSAPILTSKLPVPFATSIVHSKLDYCNSLYYNLPKFQTYRLQVIQNSLARAVVKVSKFCHVTVTPILKSLHWLKINERIEYKLLSLTTAQPTYLHSLISVQPLVLLAPHLLSPSLDHLHVHLL